MKQNKKLYALQSGLNSLVGEMDQAMQDADTLYLAQRRKPTLHMADILERLYDWAEQYESER
jgi:hypothetical protein